LRRVRADGIFNNKVLLGRNVVSCVNRVNPFVVTADQQPNTVDDSKAVSNFNLTFFASQFNKKIPKQ
jgi:hypothetical protein